MSGPSTWRLGRRGLILLAQGIVHVGYGLAVLYNPMPPFRGFDPLDVIDQRWGWIWVVCGLLAAVASLLRRSATWEGVGFNGLLVAPAVWTLVYVWSWIAWIAGDAAGNGQGWQSAMAWSGQVLAVLVVAGWPEVPASREART